MNDDIRVDVYKILTEQLIAGEMTDDEFNQAYHLLSNKQQEFIYL